MYMRMYVYITRVYIRVCVRMLFCSEIKELGIENVIQGPGNVP